MSALTSSVMDAGDPVDSAAAASEPGSSGATVRAMRESFTGLQETARESAASSLNRLNQGRGVLRGGARSFWILIAAVLTAGLFGVLILSTTVNSDAFRLHELEKQANRLSEQQQMIEKRLAAMQSPDSLERKAIELGMVPNEVPVFLRLADGKVLGVPTPAKPRPVAAPSSAGSAGTNAQTGSPSAGQASAQPGTSPAAATQADTGQSGSQSGVNP